jgi:hypothetical protein
MGPYAIDTYAVRLKHTCTNEHVEQSKAAGLLTAEVAGVSGVVLKTPFRLYSSFWRLGFFGPLFKI